ncbi:MAG: MFS transporter [Deltaproteobacteria bacterium]|nr:MAG: MFS transporter [Deltaproteobacteria bacterium]
MPDHSNVSQRIGSSSVLVWQIVIASLCRLLLSTARRFAYPFAPALSRGMGVPLTAVTSLIAVNQVTGLLGLFFGPLADRFGYRLMMMSGLGMLVLGMFSVGLWPFYWVVLVAIFMAGLAKTVYDPAVLAYTGERIPYRRRGLAIGLFEFSWAGSTLIGIPIIGFLIDRGGWRSPFFFLAGSGLVCMMVLGMLIPRDGKKTLRSASASIWVAWKQLVQKRAALGALAFALLISIAIDNLFVVYGVWLEEYFGLSIIALGLGVSLIGIAEFLGELLTALLADRVGLKRAAIIGLFITLIGFLLLPFIGKSLSPALIGLFIIFLAFEFSIVVFVSLCTEIMPELRATLISFFSAAGGLGRVIGVLIGGFIWSFGGIEATGLVSAGITALAIIAMIWGLRDWDYR